MATTFQLPSTAKLQNQDSFRANLAGKVLLKIVERNGMNAVDNCVLVAVVNRVNFLIDTLNRRQPETWQGKPL